MMLNLMDIIIVLFLIGGAILGFKRGAIQSVAVLAGTILIVFIAYYLKNPLSVILYTYLPFFKLGGVYKGMTVISILIYESLAFLIVLSLLSILLRIVLKITGIISKVVDYSIILTLPSKIIGAFVGFLEAYVFLFIVLFIFSQFSFSRELLDGSKYTDMILSKTPFTGQMKDSYKAFGKIKEIGESKNNNKKNYQALETLLEYEVITPQNANKLVENGKINIQGASKLIERYEEKND